MRKISFFAIALAILLIFLSQAVLAQPNWLKPGAYAVYSVSSKSHVEGWPEEKGTYRVDVVSVDGGRAVIRLTSSMALFKANVGDYLVDIKSRMIIQGPPASTIVGYLGFWIPEGVKPGDIITVGPTSYSVEKGTMDSGSEVYMLVWEGWAEGWGGSAKSVLIYEKNSLLFVAELLELEGLSVMESKLSDTNIKLSAGVGSPTPDIGQIPWPLYVIIAAIVIGVLYYHRKGVSGRAAAVRAQVSCPFCGARLTGGEEFCTNCGSRLRGG